MVLALPKGLVDPGEKPEQTALREVREETGLVASLVTKLGDIKYVYVRSWGDGQRVFKIVSFFLLRYLSGEIDDVSREMRVEVKRAFWIPLDEAPRKLAYRGERDVVQRAQQYLQIPSGGLIMATSNTSRPTSWPPIWCATSSSAWPTA